MHMQAALLALLASMYITKLRRVACLGPDYCLLLVQNNVELQISTLLNKFWKIKQSHNDHWFKLHDFHNWVYQIIKLLHWVMKRGCSVGSAVLHPGHCAVHSRNLTMSLIMIRLLRIRIGRQRLATFTTLLYCMTVIDGYYNKNNAA
jgi:hypothetical protein